MSTTFDVFPGQLEFPTTRAVLNAGTVKFHAYLQSLGITLRPAVTVKLLTSKDHIQQPLQLDAPFTWPEDGYLWFSVEGVPGGTDTYYRRLEPEFGHDDTTRGLPFPREQADDPALLLVAEQARYHWNFRRSAGQPGVICVLYGCLASGLASLTNGVVYSDDSAWDFGRFPARPESFDRWFMRPEGALHEDYRDWATRVQAKLFEELGLS